MTHLDIFDKIEGFLKQAGFEKVEQDKTYRDFKDKQGNFIKIFYSEGISTDSKEKCNKTSKKTVSKGKK